MTGDIPRVSPADAHALMTGEGFTYVDVRTREEFDEGRPSGAVNVPFHVRRDDELFPNPDFLSEMRARFSPQTPIILGCRSGHRSLAAARMLVAAGFGRVVDQRAGFSGVRSPFGQVTERGWEAEGLPIEGRD
jgi:rhodanese-related sulfurtransferase